MTRIFVSYARADSPFAQQLRAALVQSGYEVWLDVDEIRPGDDWLAAIERGLESATSVVFVVSPDALQSEICMHELRYAAKQGKRILMLLRRDLDGEQLPDEVDGSEWVDARDTADSAAVRRRLDCVL